MKHGEFARTTNVDGVNIYYCKKCDTQHPLGDATCAGLREPLADPLTLPKINIGAMVDNWRATPGALVHPELAKAVDAARAAPGPLDTQVAGDHYKKLKIQPIEYIHANGIPFAEGSAIKYLTRWRDKGGIKDLEKAKHFIELLIELESRDARG
jgi:hypothetical protein